jgi:hypothetical protein
LRFAVAVEPFFVDADELNERLMRFGDLPEGFFQSLLPRLVYHLGVDERIESLIRWGSATRGNVTPEQREMLGEMSLDDVLSALSLDSPQSRDVKRNHECRVNSQASAVQSVQSCFRIAISASLAIYSALNSS